MYDTRLSFYRTRKTNLIARIDLPPSLSLSLSLTHSSLNARSICPVPFYATLTTRFAYLLLPFPYLAPSPLPCFLSALVAWLCPLARLLLPRLVSLVSSTDIATFAFSSTTIFSPFLRLWETPPGRDIGHRCRLHPLLLPGHFNPSPLHSFFWLLLIEPPSRSRRTGYPLCTLVNRMGFANDPFRRRCRTSGRTVYSSIIILSRLYSSVFARGECSCFGEILIAGGKSDWIGRNTENSVHPLLLSTRSGARSVLMNKFERKIPVRARWST